MQQTLGAGTAVHDDRPPIGPAGEVGAYRGRPEVSSAAERQVVVALERDRRCAQRRCGEGCIQGDAAAAVANDQYTRELAEAGALQRVLLAPPSAELPGVRYAGTVEPAGPLASDCLKVFRLGARHIGLCVLGVSRPGVAAALLAATAGQLLARLAGGAGPEKFYLLENNDTGPLTKDAYLSHVAIVRGSLAQPELAVVDYGAIIKHAPLVVDEVTIGDGNLAPRQVRGEMTDPVGASRIKGTIIAVRNDARVKELLAGLREKVNGNERLWTEADADNNPIFGR